MECQEAKYNFGKIDVGTINPSKCRTDHGWDNWQIALSNKLNAVLDSANYIICPEVEDSDNELVWEDNEAQHYQMPLEGQDFKHNNKMVYKLLKAACVDVACTCCALQRLWANSISKYKEPTWSC